MTYRILITGSRTWDDFQVIYDALKAVVDWQADPTGGTLISGNAVGADQLAEIAAKRLGLKVEIHKPDWDKYGKRAGFVRNAEMVNSGADVCLAFIRDGSKGATMTAELSRKAGIPTRIFEQRTEDE